MPTLEKANRIKMARAALLHRMYSMQPRESHLFAADAFEDVPDVLATLTVTRFLLRVREREAQTGQRRLAAPAGGGRIRKGVLGVLNIVGIEGDCQLGLLDEYERDQLALALRVRAPLATKGEV